LVRPVSEFRMGVAAELRRIVGKPAVEAVDQDELRLAA
jgi:hypothetical protein